MMNQGGWDGWGMQYAWADEKCVEVYVGRSEVTEKTQHRREDSFKEMGRKGVNWIRVVQERDQQLAVVDKAVVNEPSDSFKGLEYLHQLSDYYLSGPWRYSFFRCCWMFVV
jgi:hypothetical protein